MSFLDSIEDLVAEQTPIFINVELSAGEHRELEMWAVELAERYGRQIGVSDVIDSLISAALKERAKQAPKELEAKRDVRGESHERAGRKRDGESLSSDDVEVVEVVEIVESDSEVIDVAATPSPSMPTPMATPTPTPAPAPAPTQTYDESSSDDGDDEIVSAQTAAAAASEISNVDENADEPKKKKLSTRERVSAVESEISEMVAGGETKIVMSTLVRKHGTSVATFQKYCQPQYHVYVDGGDSSTAKPSTPESDSDGGVVASGNATPSNDTDESANADGDTKMRVADQFVETPQPQPASPVAQKATQDAVAASNSADGGVSVATGGTEAEAANKAASVAEQGEQGANVPSSSANGGDTPQAKQWGAAGTSSWQ